MADGAAWVPPRTNRGGHIGFGFHESHFWLVRSFHPLSRDGHQRGVHLALIFAHHVNDVAIAGRVHHSEYVLAGGQGLATHGCPSRPRQTINGRSNCNFLPL
jgi:hypothetical protein